MGTELARSLRSVVLAYDVDNIVLGGGVTRAGDRYLQPIIAEWLRQQETSALARAALRPEILRIADPTRNLGAWGAAALAAELVGQQNRNDGAHGDAKGKSRKNSEPPPGEPYVVYPASDDIDARSADR